MNQFKINLKHLRYFWTVATMGSLTEASKVLHLTPQTISGQLRTLEQNLGDKLFQREGRHLVLTEFGRIVFSYADEMFQVGLELQDVLAGETVGVQITVRVGVAMVVPKLLALKVLEPVFQLNDSINLICHEAPLVDLLADLSVHKLDAVLSDSPVNPALNIRAYNHSLGETDIAFFASKELRQSMTDEFPKCLNQAPMLMPGKGSSLRRSLEAWLEKQNVKPRVVAEFEDRALMKAFGERGIGVFTSPQIMQQEVMSKYGVELLGVTSELQESYYLISPERRIKNPAVTLISDNARNRLFD